MSCTVGLRFGWWSCVTISDDHFLDVTGVVAVGEWDVAVVEHALTHNHSASSYFESVNPPELKRLDPISDLKRYIEDRVPITPSVEFRTKIVAPRWLSDQCKELYTHERSWLRALARTQE